MESSDLYSRESLERRSSPLPYERDCLYLSGAVGFVSIINKIRQLITQKMENKSSKRKRKDSSRRKLRYVCALREMNFAPTTLKASCTKYGSPCQIWIYSLPEHRWPERMRIPSLRHPIITVTASRSVVFFQQEETKMSRYSRPPNSSLYVRNLHHETRLDQLKHL